MTDDIDTNPRYTRIPCGCVFGSEPLPDGGDAFVYKPCSQDCEYYLYTQRAATEQGKPFRTINLTGVGAGSVETFGSPCPVCGQVNEMAYDISGGGATPSPGDWTLCAGCYGAMRFDDNLAMRLPTEAELADMPFELAVLQRRAMDGKHR